MPYFGNLNATYTWRATPVEGTGPSVSRTVSQESVQVNVSELRPFTLYNFSVTARNILGESLPTSIIRQTPETGLSATASPSELLSLCISLSLSLFSLQVSIFKVCAQISIILRWIVLFEGSLPAGVASGLLLSEWPSQQVCGWRSQFSRSTS